MSAQPRRIVVGVDDSEPSRRALERAADLTGYGSTLTVVSVARDGDRYAEGPLEKAREQLLRRHVSATYLQPVGDPAAELVDAARELEADLVVLGRRSRSLRRLVLGSVSDAVVRRAPCDVLVVR
jgi:nucleotide-binding universal stress UspA family protein